MSFVEGVQKKPLTVLTLFTIVVIIGIIMASTLSVALMPEVEIPVVAVQAVYAGASPEEVEKEIIQPLEEGLSTLSGVDTLSSTAAENYGSIVMWFQSGIDTDKAADDAEKIVKRIRSTLPEEAEEPQVLQFDPNSMPVMDLTLFGNRPIYELGRMAEDVVKVELERIPGVAQVNISGDREREIHVDVVKNRLEAHNLSLQMISGSLAQQNLDLSAGSLGIGDQDFVLTTKGEYRSLEDIEETVISRVPMGQGGESHEILLRDVADVSFGWAQESTKVLINGKEGIAINLIATEEANIVELSQQVRKAQVNINQQLPQDVEVKILGDNSERVNQVLMEVISSAVIGVIFAVLVLALFLGRLNSTLIVALSIPVSIMMTIAGLAIAGKTFNMLTLGGLLLGVGMIVDGSIVVLENIEKYRSRGILAKTASLIGTREMVAPITGSILTSISVFVPMFIMKEQMGIMGALFGDLSLTVILSLSSSLLVAVVLVPVLSSLTSKDELGAEAEKRHRISAFIDSRMAALEKGYKRALALAVKRKYITILTVFFIMVGSFFLLPSIGLEFAPPSEEDVVILDVELPTGTNLETTTELLRQLEQAVFEEVQGYETVITTAGGEGDYLGSIKIILPPIKDQVESLEEIKDVLRGQYPLFPQGKFSFADTDSMSQMSGGEGDIKVGIVGQDIESLTLASEELSTLIRQNIPGISEITSSATQGLPEIEIRIDRKKAFDLGLNTSGIAQELRGQITGYNATTYSDGEDSVDVVLRLREEDRNSVSDLDNLYVMNARGQKVAVSNFAQLVYSQTPASITRENQSRSVSISGNLLPGYQANFVQQEVEALIAQSYELPEGIRLEYGGAMDNINESMGGMAIVLLVAILLVFGVMVSQFESLRAPFIIFLAMPTMMVGVLLAFYFTGIPFSTPAMIGLIMLAGIVVNNGIILVDYINLLRKRDYPLLEAIVEAGGSRLRPVLMTTLTTVLAMVPMAFFPGEGAEMLQALGLTVVGGLTFNTITTLFVVPALYGVVYRGHTISQGV